MRKKSGGGGKRKIVIGFAAYCISLLFLFKYFGFFCETAAAVAGLFSVQLHPVTLSLLLPVGISFYTFQTLSYVIDVYRGKIKAERDFVAYAAFISFFPQLVAGPIERTDNLLPQIHSVKRFDCGLAMYGARQMLWGFFKKIAVADVVSVYVDRAYSGLRGCTPLDLCIAIFFFTIQIYCDFSGYSDIAIGVAKLFGINLTKNFSSPYFALSVREFWSRWHISLSTWFRDYVYIPLGGSRCSKIRGYCNLMATFLVSGLWHGANWTFVFWGGMHGAAQALERLTGQKDKSGKAAAKAIRWLIVFAFCNVAWVFFRAESFGDAIYIIKNAFGGIADINGYLHSNIGISRERALFSLAAVAIVWVYDFLSLKIDLIQYANQANRAKRAVVIVCEYALVAMIGLAVLYGAGSDQFVYFQF